MSVQVELLEKSMAKLTIEVPAEEVEKAIQTAYQKRKGQFNIPGFRRGKVPRQMIEKMYGPEVFYEDAANEMIPPAYEKAYGECGLEIVSSPAIDLVQMKKGEPFIFTAEVAVKPEVTLGQYKGLEVEKIPVEVTEEEIEQKLKEEAEKNSRMITVEDRPAAEGDEVILDYEGFVDDEPFAGGKGEGHPLTLGSGSFIPGFEEQLIGVMPESDVEVKVTFPEDYHAEELQGKEAIFKCTVHEIKVKELPEIDDEFAAEVSEFDTLDEYKEDLAKKLTEEKEKQAKGQKEDKLMAKAIDGASMEIPEPMIQAQIRQAIDDFSRRIMGQGFSLEQYMQYTGLTEETLAEQYRPQTIKQIEGRLVLEAIAKAEGIEITDERMDEEYAKLADAYQMEVERVKEYMGEENKKMMKEDLACQAALDLLLEHAVEVEPAPAEESTEE